MPLNITICRHLNQFFSIKCFKVKFQKSQKQTVVQWGDSISGQVFFAKPGLLFERLIRSVFYEVIADRRKIMLLLTPREPFFFYFTKNRLVAMMKHHMSIFYIFVLTIGAKLFKLRSIVDTPLNSSRQI